MSIMGEVCRGTQDVPRACQRSEVSSMRVRMGVESAHEYHWQSRSKVVSKGEVAMVTITYLT